MHCIHRQALTLPDRHDLHKALYTFFLIMSMFPDVYRSLRDPVLFFVAIHGSPHPHSQNPDNTKAPSATGKRLSNNKTDAAFKRLIPVHAAGTKT